MDTTTLNAISLIDTNWLASVQLSWQSDPQIQQLITGLTQDANSHVRFLWDQGVLTHKEHLVVGNSTDLKHKIIEEYHNSSVGGHSGIDKTSRRIKRTFYWKGLQKDVQQFISECHICQRFNGENVHVPGLLQPLLIPEKEWTNISMDFIEGLPKSQRKTTIFVVVDRLTKYAHFMPLSHPCTAKDVAQLFLDNIYKLHGVPATIVFDRDAVFTSTFWQEFFKLQGSQLCLSTAYHPHSDGQTEIVNKCIEIFLRCMCGDCPKHWAKWLSLEEWWYSTSFHSSIKTTPFYAVYGQEPPKPQLHECEDFFSGSCG